jgi:uncharacterized protein (DUF4213/DUF364 family)
VQLIDDLIGKLPDGEVQDICVGLHWTAVVVEVEGIQNCGLASTLSSSHPHHRRSPDVPQAGALRGLSTAELASWSTLDSPTLNSIGIATLNALLPKAPHTWVDANAEEIIAHNGRGKRVALVGHFPFAERLASQVGELVVLEQNPGFGDLPAGEAPTIIPRSEVVAITGMTLANHTLESLLDLCTADSFVILLGPSTPLSPLLFDFGVDVISGAVVESIPNVVRVVREGGNFRQVHRAGVRLVNIFHKNQEPG